MDRATDIVILTDTLLHENLRLAEFGGTYRFLYEREKEESRLINEKFRESENTSKMWMEKHADCYRDLRKEERKKKMWRTMGSTGTIVGAVGGFLVGVFIAK